MKNFHKNEAAKNWKTRRLKKEDKDFDNNNIFTSYRTFFIMNSIGIDYGRLLSYGGKVGSYSGKYLVTNLGISALFGSYGSYFELGAGVHRYIKIDGKGDVNFLNSDRSVNASIGYRYQEQKSIIFRTGLSYTEGLYISVGAPF
jgi:hypothetical protein